MANAVTITIRDRSKTAICKETLALCGKYDVTVEDMLADGYIVLHRDIVLPSVWPYHPDGQWAAPTVDEADWYGYCELEDGEGELDLGMENLVNTLSKTNPLNAVVPVKFSVYKTGDGLVGTGTMQVLVTQPYTTTSQSFVTFKGDKGDKGDTGASAGFGEITASASTLTPGSSATATVSASGPDTAKAMAFAFGIPRGDKGDTGDAAGFGTPTATATQVAAGGSPTATVTTDATSPATAKIFNFAFGIPKGDTGSTGKSAYEIWLENGHTGTEEDFLTSLIGGDYLGMQAEVAASVAASAAALHVSVYQKKRTDKFVELGEALELGTNASGEKTVLVK